MSKRQRVSTVSSDSKLVAEHDDDASTSLSSSLTTASAPTPAPSSSSSSASASSSSSAPSSSKSNDPAWRNASVVPEISDGFVYHYPWTLFGYDDNDTLPAPDTIDTLVTRSATDIRALVNLGWITQFGVCGVTKNVVAAVGYYRRAARHRVAEYGDHNSGDRNAWFNWACMLLDGVGCERDRDSAIRAFRRAEGAIIDTTADTHPDNRLTGLDDMDDDDDDDDDGKGEQKKDVVDKNPQPCVSIVDLSTNDTGFHFEPVLQAHCEAIFKRYMAIASSWQPGVQSTSIDIACQGKAMYVVGRCFNEGLAVPIDRARAIEWHQRGAEQLNDMECQCSYAWSYELGEGVAKDSVKAFDLHLVAAERGFDRSQHFIATSYRSGEPAARMVGVTQDHMKSEARRWMTLAAMQGRYNNSMSMLGCYYRDIPPKDYKKALEWWQISLDAGNGNAANHIGDAYAGATGVERSMETAFKYFTMGADMGTASAMQSLAWCKRYAGGTTRDDAAAWKYWCQSSRNGDNEGLLNLGNMYRDGLFVKRSYVNAMIMYKRAVDKYNTEAYASIGKLYELGQGVPKDHSEAFAWYSKGAVKEDVRCEYAVAIAYLDGIGTEKKEDMAVEYLLRAAAQDHVRACEILGDCYNAGRGCTQDYRKANEWWMKAVDLGSKSSMHAIAFAYEYGEGVEQCIKTAFDWYKRSAEAGDSLAQVRMSRFAIEGIHPDEPQRQPIDPQYLPQPPAPLAHLPAPPAPPADGAMPVVVANDGLANAPLVAVGDAPPVIGDGAVNAAAAANIADLAPPLNGNGANGMTLLASPAAPAPPFVPNYHEAMNWLRRAARSGDAIACQKLAHLYSIGVDASAATSAVTGSGAGGAGDGGVRNTPPSIAVNPLLALKYVRAAVQFGSTIDDLIRCNTCTCTTPYFIAPIMPPTRSSSSSPSSSSSSSSSSDVSYDMAVSEYIAYRRAMLRATGVVLTNGVHSALSMMEIIHAVKQMLSAVLSDDSKQEDRNRNRSSDIMIAQCRLLCVTTHMPLPYDITLLVLHYLFDELTLTDPLDTDDAALTRVSRPSATIVIRYHQPIDTSTSAGCETKDSDRHDNTNGNGDATDTNSDPKTCSTWVHIARLFYDMLFMAIPSPTSSSIITMGQSVWRMSISDMIQSLPSLVIDPTLTSVPTPLVALLTCLLDDGGDNHNVAKGSSATTPTPTPSTTNDDSKRQSHDASAPVPPPASPSSSGSATSSWQRASPLASRLWTCCQQLRYFTHAHRGQRRYDDSPHVCHGCDRLVALQRARGTSRWYARESIRVLNYMATPFTCCHCLHLHHEPNDWHRYDEDEPDIDEPMVIPDENLDAIPALPALPLAPAPVELAALAAATE